VIDFRDQAVIVTGAGRGLGRCYALEFGRLGASVVVNDIGGTIKGRGQDKSVADAVVAEISRAGGKAVASYDSVATPEGGAAIVRTAMQTFGRLDAVVSNAGILTTDSFERISHQQWRDMLSVHLDGAFFLSQPAFSVMKAQGYGRFVFTSSSAAMFGAEHHAHYAAAKTGLFGLKNVIAIEGQSHGILANNVLPWGLTRMIASEVGDNQEFLQSPMMRMLEPELVAPLVVYLASRACTISHQDFSAAAGRYARVFTALGAGWAADAGVKPTVDDVAANFSEISTTTSFQIPFSTTDETIEICKRRGIALPFAAAGDAGRQDAQHAKS
jgi:NAD(P)-dependent dehydrogenase (short-subunit alcohol dehydrogenase family)